MIIDKNTYSNDSGDRKISNNITPLIKNDSNNDCIEWWW